MAWKGYSCATVAQWAMWVKIICVPGTETKNLTASRCPWKQS